MYINKYIFTRTGVTPNRKEHIFKTHFFCVYCQKLYRELYTREYIKATQHWYHIKYLTYFLYYAHKSVSLSPNAYRNRIDI